MIAIPNMDKPQSCWDCVRHFDFECSGDIRNCPIIEIDESEMEYLYQEFGLEKDENLTDRAKELKKAILMGYLYAKKDIVRCGECRKVDTKKCPMYSAGWGYTDDDWCSEGERANNTRTE